MVTLKYGGDKAKFALRSALPGVSAALWLAGATTALSIAFVSGASASTVDVVTNGGFEGGNSGFSTDYTQGSLNNVSNYGVVGSYSGLTAHGGSLFMAVNGHFDTSTVTYPTVWSQTVSLISGNTYSFSAWMADWSGFLPKAGLSVQINGSEFATMTAPGSEDTWSEMTGSFVATSSGAATLSFVETTSAFGGNDYGLDDITLTTEVSGVGTTPLPAALPLFASGLGAMSLFGWRRKRKAQAVA